MGGRSILITFQSKEVRDDLIKGPWMKVWFTEIGELWGNFVELDNETLRDLSFAKGKVLIATEEPNKIDKWIQLEVQGLIYDVHVIEDYTCVSPNDIMETLVASLKAPISKETFQKKGDARSEEEEDDDVECLGLGSTNGRRGSIVVVDNVSCIFVGLLENMYELK
ncbi:hypothetical protein RHMOL_Rhmol02G0140200 [Rhododendron molle]|uniref:Uncharacterized protein n=1 Tax=Rhododendron molle TaxID=49168 RepID=A0ACC0PR85_RHOML|nr:hypothetical protein RHMOL_Rhmol02G0140200 [Rhododendron molle]